MQTNVFEITVQYFDKMVNDFKGFELIVIRINAHTKVQAGVPENVKISQFVQFLKNYQWLI